jgi:hypothetical protein
VVHNNGAEDVELLIQKFGFFGIEGQIWMLLVAFLITVFVVCLANARSDLSALPRHFSALSFQPLKINLVPVLTR